MWHGLQPYVLRAATLCGTGCNPMWHGLQPYVALLLRVGEQRLRPRLERRCEGGCEPALLHARLGGDNELTCPRRGDN